MKNKLVGFFVLVFIGVSAFSMAGETGKARSESVVPFELLDHLILVKGKINDSDQSYNFVLDTGAVTVIDKALADELQLKQLGPQAKIDSLHLGELAVEKLFAFTKFDLTQLSASYGVDLSGMIGSDLLDRYIVTIDYEKKQLILSSDMESLAEEKKNSRAGHFFKFTRHPVNTAPMIKCKLNGNIEMEAMIDTGQPYPLVLPLTELEKTGASQKKSTLKAKGATVKWPGTTSPDIFLARSDSLSAGDLKADQVMTVFAELPAALSVPLLGGDFLSRYLIKIDFFHEEIMLLPKTGYRGLDHSFSTGLHVYRNAENRLAVRGVWEKSPADLAGIQVEDLILEFNAKKATPERHQELWLLLNDDQVKSVKLLIETNKGPRKLHLKKKKLI